MAFRSQTFVSVLPGLRDSGRPAPVKGKSSIRQGVTAYPLILIFPDPLQLLYLLRRCGLLFVSSGGLEPDR